MIQNKLTEPLLPPDEKLEIITEQPGAFSSSQVLMAEDIIHHIITYLGSNKDSLNAILAINKHYFSATYLFLTTHHPDYFYKNRASQIQQSYRFLDKICSSYRKFFSTHELNNILKVLEEKGKRGKSIEKNLAPFLIQESEKDYEEENLGTVLCGSAYSYIGIVGVLSTTLFINGKLIPAVINSFIGFGTCFGLGIGICLFPALRNALQHFQKLNEISENLKKNNQMGPLRSIIDHMIWPNKTNEQFEKLYKKFEKDFKLTIPSNRSS